MKKMFKFSYAAITLAFLFTSCGNENSSASSDTTSGEEAAVENQAEGNADENSQGNNQSDSFTSWCLTPYDDGLEQGGDIPGYSMNIAQIAEIDNGEVCIEEKGSGSSKYYVITPTLTVIEPNEDITRVTGGIELLDEAGSPIPYTYTLAGEQYSNTNHLLTNDSAVLKALKNGGECKMVFTIKPTFIEDFSTDMFEEAKYFRIMCTANISNN